MKSLIKMENAKAIRIYQKRIQPTGKIPRLLHSRHNGELNGDMTLVPLCGVKVGEP